VDRSHSSLDRLTPREFVFRSVTRFQELGLPQAVSHVVGHPAPVLRAHELDRRVVTHAEADGARTDGAHQTRPDGDDVPVDVRILGEILRPSLGLLDPVRQ